MKSLLLFFLLGASVPTYADSALTPWDRITVAPMKTSIYVGNVKLITGVFVRQGSTLSTTVRVVPLMVMNASVL